MWARILEVSLGCWLLLSPFIFSPSQPEVWWIDFTGGVAIIAAALLSFSSSLRRAYLFSIVTALCLMARAFFFPEPAPPAAQNHMVVGLLLAMLAIIPVEAGSPPISWRTEINKESNV